MRAYVLLLAACFAAAVAHAQQYTLGGNVKNETGAPMPFATVALLQPSDSTLAYFGVTDEEGAFLIKAISKGDYLLQVATMGFTTFYKTVQVPVAGNNAGDIVLREKSKLLQEVQVSAEKIPFLVKKDTIEYNAGAYKVKPDATVEDLLKKLPGVEVDKAGNVKANGRDVTKVLVDGKEFFGDDPKVATKNLPSDAINKVQVFDKRSDQSLFTGIDDGERERTVNLLLKDNRKSGYFGDVQAGGGTGDHFRLNGKLYRFSKRTQFAALGMVNNINQFGFTLDDYINFRGGLRSLMDGSGNVALRFNNNMPVNFGQPQPGFITSGAAGVNYTYEWSKDNILNVSYLGNGADNKLNEITATENFTANDPFFVDQHINEHSQNQAHRINMSWRARADSSTQVSLNGNAEITGSQTARKNRSRSSLNDVVLNELDSRLDDERRTLGAGGRFTFVKKYKTKWPVLRLHSDINFEKGITNTKWNNLATYLASGVVNDRQYQDNQTAYVSFSAGGALVRNTGNGYYVEADMTGGTDRDALNRVQGQQSETPLATDSLSRNFARSYNYMRPSLTLRKHTEDVQFSAGLKLENGMPGAASAGNSYRYLLPFASWQYEYKQGKEVRLSYNSSINLPSARQMFPIADRTNPLYVIYGNTLLKPEYLHELAANWHNFDQFDFTSVFANINLRYTADKIILARSINPDLSQLATFVNTKGNYTVVGRAEYSMPVRKIGINATIGISENYNRAVVPVNHVENINNTFTHEVNLTLANRKKEKIEAEISGSAAISSARYSLDRALNNDYYKYSGIARISYRPVSYLYFMAEADISYYDALNFSQPVTIPLLNAEVSYFFLKAKRGVLTLEAFDLLNRNTSIRRISQLNFLEEIRSNIIGRYVMLSFKYRLSLMGKEPGISISNR